MVGHRCESLRATRRRGHKEAVVKFELDFLGLGYE